LLVMNRWGTWVRRHYGQPMDTYEQKPWNPAYAFNEPVLDFNTAMDILAAICAFFLTRLWVIRVRQRDKQAISQFTGVIPGLIAALTVWFNPAMIVSAYGWPTWDAWIIPMYLLTALLASLDWWFCAGLAIAVGAMFKGQQLTVAPVFLIWALMLGQLGSAARWCAGLITGMAVIASPWLFTYLPPDVLEQIRWTNRFNFDSDIGFRRIVEYPAIFWVLGIIAATTAIPLISRRIAARLRANSTHAWKVIAATGWLWLVLAAAAIWPWFIPRNRPDLWLGIILSAALVAAAIFLRRKSEPFVVAAAGGIACLLCILVFHGSHAWWDCGFHFGTVHWKVMVMGKTDNIAGLLANRYQWPGSATGHLLTVPSLGSHWPIYSSLHIWPAAPLDLTTKMFFDSLYTLLLIISGIGLGLQARRRDPRFLAALVTPWVLFFTIPVQIHERYLLFAAGSAAICIGESVGTWLLGLFLSFLTMIMTLHVMLLHGGNGDIDFGQKLSILFPWLFSPDSGHIIFKYIDGSFPDAAWAVILACGIFLYLSLAPSRRPTLR
jgi:hypothetical protein